MNREALDLLRRCAQELGVEIRDHEIVLFDSLAEELKKWNKKINLTAIHNDRDIVIKHFVDSFSLLEITGNNGLLLDLGSGGGFPCIPLKIMRPELSIVSVDAVEKKILFQRHTARLLHLRNFTALHARGEALRKEQISSFDIIVSRAFSNLAYFAELALPLIKDRGKIVAMKGKEGKREAEAEEKQLADRGARVTDCVHLTLPVTGEDRYLIVMEKAYGKREENILKNEY